MHENNPEVTIVAVARDCITTAVSKYVNVIQEQEIRRMYGILGYVQQTCQAAIRDQSTASRLYSSGSERPHHRGYFLTVLVYHGVKMSCDTLIAPMSRLRDRDDAPTSSAHEQRPSGYVCVAVYPTSSVHTASVCTSYVRKTGSIRSAMYRKSLTTTSVAVLATVSGESATRVKSPAAHPTGWRTFPVQQE